MNQIQLKAAKGRIIATLPAYESLYQVPLSRYIDFLKAREALDDKEKLEAGEVNVARVLAQSVGAFMGVPVDEVLRAEYGDFEDVDDISKNLTSLYMWIVNLLGTFTPKIRKPEDCIFEYKGEQYTIPTIGFQALANLPLLPDLETGEMIEAYEIKRMAQAKIQSDDPEGSYLFTYYLRLLAVLCRKEDERFPVFESDVEVFINERLLHFQEIDAGTALDVDFFLASLMRPSVRTGAAVGFLSNRLFDLAQAHAKRRKQKPKPSIARFKEQKKLSQKLGGGKRTSNSLNGDGSKRTAKARLKQ